jgi:L-ribulose-5-phosphate 4-epimerase
MSFRSACLTANKDLVTHGLALLTWGNASCLDSSENVMLIKPSGIAYHEITEEKLVAVRVSDGLIREHFLFVSLNDLRKGDHLVVK